MIVRCRGNCGKVRTEQPYKSTRVVEFLCASCERKYATRAVAVKPVVAPTPRHHGVSLMLNITKVRKV